MANLADFGCGLCEWERRPVGTKHAELVRVKQCASCRLGSLRENAASSTGYEAVDAYRDAVLAAERQRLLALTPEEEVEEAAKRITGLDGKPERCVKAEEFVHDQKRCGLCQDTVRWNLAASDLRAALPVLLAPEVAKREAAERDAEEFERAFENAMDGLRLTAEEKEDVRQTPALNLSLKCNEAVNRAIVAERDRDHNERAVHVTREELRAAEAEVARLKGALKELRGFFGVVPAARVSEDVALTIIRAALEAK